jgi:hypothetical protein
MKTEFPLMKYETYGLRYLGTPMPGLRHGLDRPNTQKAFALSN